MELLKYLSSDSYAQRVILQMEQYAASPCFWWNLVDFHMPEFPVDLSRTSFLIVPNQLLQTVAMSQLIYSTEAHHPLILLPPVTFPRNESFPVFSRKFGLWFIAFFPSYSSSLFLNVSLQKQRLYKNTSAHCCNLQVLPLPSLFWFSTYSWGNGSPLGGYYP